MDNRPVSDQALLTGNLAYQKSPWREAELIWKLGLIVWSQNQKSNGVDLSALSAQAFSSHTSGFGTVGFLVLCFGLVERSRSFWRFFHLKVFKFYLFVMRWSSLYPAPGAGPPNLAHELCSWAMCWEQIIIHVLLNTQDIWGLNKERLVCVPTCGGQVLNLETKEISM